MLVSEDKSEQLSGFENGSIHILELVYYNLPFSGAGLDDDQVSHVLQIGQHFIRALLYSHVVLHLPKGSHNIDSV